MGGWRLIFRGDDSSSMHLETDGLGRQYGNDVWRYVTYHSTSEGIHDCSDRTENRHRPGRVSRRSALLVQPGADGWTTSPSTKVSVSSPKR